MCGFELAGGRRNYGLKKSALNKIKQELELSYFSLQKLLRRSRVPRNATAPQAVRREQDVSNCGESVYLQSVQNCNGPATIPKQTVRTTSQGQIKYFH